MYVKQLFENKTVSKVVIITLASLYVLCILTCSVSFFTPNWLLDVVHIQGIGYLPLYFVFYSANYIETFQRMCDTVGLVSGDCRYPYPDASVPDVYSSYTLSVTSLDDTDIRRTFYCMLITMCILYSNFAMTISAFLFNMLDNRIYMTALSISYGVLYPLGAILVLTVTITLEVKNPSSIGYSTILGNVSAGLMVLFAVHLWLLGGNSYTYTFQLSVNGGAPCNFTMNEVDACGILISHDSPMSSLPELTKVDHSIRESNHDDNSPVGDI